MLKTFCTSDVNADDASRVKRFLDHEEEANKPIDKLRLSRALAEPAVEDTVDVTASK